MNTDTPAAALVLAAPPAASFTLAEGETERDAELLVAGNYPAKNLKVTEADLDDIVAAFSADTVPIKVEHVNSPLDPLGLVQSLRRDGKRLLGRIAFDPAAAALIAKRAVKGLSVGLDRVTGSGKLCLSEVSLVLRPHVPSAALLSEDDRVSQLEAKLNALDADSRIRELKRAGKLVPAAEVHARALLSVGDGARITLADGSAQSVAEAAFALLSALPASVRFTETAPGKRTNLYGGPAGAAASTEEDPAEGLPELTATQQDFVTRVLRVDPDKVRRAMKETQDEKEAA